MSKRFPILGTLAALVGIGCAAAVAVSTVADPELRGLITVMRLTTGVVASLSFVAAEALWWPRRWVLRAVDTWALACTAAPVVAAVLGGGDFQTVALTIGFSAFVIGLPSAFIRQYVEVRAQRLGLIPAAPRPALPRAP